MARLFLTLIAALLAGALAGCDFSPALDVPLPEFEPALTVNGVLAADSTVELRVTATRDPYVTTRSDGLYVPRDRFFVPDGTTVELFRDGAPLGPLRLDSVACNSNDPYTDPTDVPQAECGSFVSDIVVEAGATYTLRATAPGYPAVEATVTVPPRVPVALEVAPTTVGSTPGWTLVERDLRVSVRDPAGLGDRYALAAVTGPRSQTRTPGTWCEESGCTHSDSTFLMPLPRAQLTFTTADPVLLAAARAVPSIPLDLVMFSDDTFDGAARTFEIRVRQYVNPEREDPMSDLDLEAVWLIALDAATYDAYQVFVAEERAGADNPFAEPADLPSNVTGGYGILGAVTINAVRVE